jgi:hypothetical protein
MANNYYDMTGVLVLNIVTPVIKALFGPLELDENHPGNGIVYIANISESTSCSWDSVLENLRELAERLGLSQPEDAEDEIEEYLNVLATHFCAESNTEIANLIEMTDFENDADVDTLFTIALAFDDGHGLKSYKTETSWHCSKPRLFEFGGAGDFRGLHISMGDSSDRTAALGEALDDALTSDETDKAAEILYRKVEGILNGVFDEIKRSAMRSKLSALLAAPVSTM